MRARSFGWEGYKGGLSCVPDINKGAHSEDEPFQTLSSDDSVKEHIKTQELEGVLVVSTAARCTTLKGSATCQALMDLLEVERTGHLPQPRLTWLSPPERQPNELFLYFLLTRWVKRTVAPKCFSEPGLTPESWTGYGKSAGHCCRGRKVTCK